MSETTSKFDNDKEKVLVENNAQSIFDYLNDLEKENKIASKRWFWELLQNAKDAVGNSTNSKVAVRVRLENNRLTFSHTGEPFENQDILHLIYHGSSKKNKVGKTGRFGTGFMTTHLLSRKVNVTGKLNDNTYFQFELDRVAETDTVMEAKLEKSYLAFCNSNNLENYSTDGYDTKFSYELSDAKSVKEGITQLSKILPFVIAFNEKIENIEIISDGITSNFSRIGIHKNMFKDVELWKQEISCDGITNYVFYVKLPDSYVAILAVQQEDSFAIINLDDTYPKLYFDFPLFGTEELGMPVVINSTKFDLLPERHGVYLGQGTQPSILTNKTIIQESFDIINILIEYFSQNHANDILNLFKINQPKQYEWLDNQWLQKVYTEQIAKNLDLPCYNFFEVDLKLEDLVIPYSQQIALEVFYRVVTQLIKGKSPEFSQIKDWIKIAEGYANLQRETNITYLPFIIHEEKVCKIINDCYSIQNLQKKLSDQFIEDNFEDSKQWLNSFFDLLSVKAIEGLTAQFSIIPNQLKIFVKRETAHPYIDEIGNEKIKPVATAFGWKISSELILQGINVKPGIFQNMTLEKVLNYISTAGEKISDVELDQKNNRDALIKYLHWLISHKKKDLLKNALVIYEKSKDTQDGQYSKRRLFTSNSEKMIAPFEIWQNSFSLYSEIVPKRFILIEQYVSLLTSEDFYFLESESLIFSSPLILRKTPSKVEIRYLLKQPEDTIKLLNDAGELIDMNIAFSDIPYLTRSEDYILVRTSDSFKSARTLLKFILTQVINKDEYFGKSQTINSNGSSIILNQCLWIGRLRETQWVPIRNSEGDKQITSERPSATNITDLVKTDSALEELIMTKSAAQFFQALGISTADILRNTIADEELKLKWDMAFSTLLVGKKIDPELAVEMLEDKNLQEKYQDQKERKRKIKQNQQIGFLFEKIFKQIFESDEYKSAGFFINRKPVGSDYEITYEKMDIIEEEDILDENNIEVLYEVGRFLIELKATGKSYAEMTPKQAEVAREAKENYILAVLPLNNFEINEINVREHTRFITKIHQIITGKVEDYNSYIQGKKGYTIDHGDITLNIQDGNVRFQVKESLWKTSEPMNLENFINWIINKPFK